MADGEWLAPRRLNALPYEEQRDYIRTFVEASDSEESDHEQAVDQEDLEGNIDDIGGESSDAEQVQEIVYHLEDERDSDEEYEEPPLETGDYYTARDGNVWSSIPPIPGRIRAHNVLRSRNPGPVPSTNGLTMAETFNLMMSNEICDVIIRESNRKARQTFDAYNEQHPDAEPRIWVPITEVEFRAYLGVLLMAGVCHSGYVHTTDLWKTTSHPLFRASMSLRRFWAISRFIRFDNGNTRNARKQNDKAAAITDVFLMLNATLRKYYICGTNVTVDEQLYPYRGGTGFTQYIPSKPSKYGIKVWWVCDAISSYPVQVNQCSYIHFIISTCCK